jgi:hypothetical protein
MVGKFIIVQRYSRAEAHANRDKLYVFGDNMAGRGFGGQAGEMRGVPNAVGIPTKWRPSREPSAYFTNGDLRDGNVKQAIMGAIAELEKHLLAGGDIVYPADGVGTGLSELPTRAPDIMEFIDAGIDRLKLIAATGDAS